MLFIHSHCAHPIQKARDAHTIFLIRYHNENLLLKPQKGKIQPRVWTLYMSQDTCTHVEQKSLVEKLASWVINTPLIVPLWFAARRLMIDTAENLGIPWRQQVKELASSRKDWNELLRSVCNPAVTVPFYYSKTGSYLDGGISFHGYPSGNLLLGGGEQHLASKAVGARNFEEAGALGEEVFRGKYSQFIKENIRDKYWNGSKGSGKYILDVGCGTGTSTEDLLQLFPEAKVVGIDLSPYMVAVAKHRFPSSPIEFLHGLAERTNFPANSFDLVSLCLLVHELPYEATRNVLKECFRILKKNGFLALFEMDPTWEGNKKLRRMPVIFTLMRSTEPYLEEYFYRVAPHFEQVLEEAGFHFEGVKQGLSKRGHLALFAKKEI